MVNADFRNNGLTWLILRDPNSLIKESDVYVLSWATPSNDPLAVHKTPPPTTTATRLRYNN